VAPKERLYGLRFEAREKRLAEQGTAKETPEEKKPEEKQVYAMVAIAPTREGPGDLAQTIERLGTKASGSIVQRNWRSEMRS
jgi:hypothetical protein